MVIARPKQSPIKWNCLLTRRLLRRGAQAPLLATTWLYVRDLHNRQLIHHTRGFDILQIQLQRPASVIFVGFDVIHHVYAVR